ncbi:MAG TPA: hypothetical protein DCO68_04810 [Methylophilaceae bacterium]|nr:hypothetical protein [Methylophilaceae bacterium]
MQSQIVAGDSFNLLDTFADYPASEGWVLKTRFVPRLSTAVAFTLIATAEGANYRTTAEANTTANWTAGVYTVTQWLEKSGDRITLTTGVVTILPNSETLPAGYDDRSHVEKTLAAIEAMLEGKATKDVQQYTIGDRQLQHIPLSELLVWRDKYKFQLASENSANSASKKLGRKIYMRF